ncbi:hypothetical protein B0O80DRAFT_196529 [Mortierella sp. GBAus27b]|nr:hypothetical protein B0O80DRAFT_196529 [Mortierella sp. GBAus27b]
MVFVNGQKFAWYAPPHTPAQSHFLLFSLCTLAPFVHVSLSNTTLGCTAVPHASRAIARRLVTMGKTLARHHLSSKPRNGPPPIPSLTAHQPPLPYRPLLESDHCMRSRRKDDPRPNACTARSCARQSKSA